RQGYFFGLKFRTGASREHNLKAIKPERREAEVPFLVLLRASLRSPVVAGYGHVASLPAGSILVLNRILVPPIER
ncbi:MAG: hypothetical protein DLM52_11155, partial [Chthoniobacterales bacterium]